MKRDAEYKPQADPLFVLAATPRPQSTLRLYSYSSTRFLFGLAERAATVGIIAQKNIDFNTFLHICKINFAYLQNKFSLNYC